MKEWGDKQRNRWLIVMVVLFALGGICSGAAKAVELLWGTH